MKRLKHTNLKPTRPQVENKEKEQTDPPDNHKQESLPKKEKEEPVISDNGQRNESEETPGPELTDEEEETTGTMGSTQLKKIYTTDTTNKDYKLDREKLKRARREQQEKEKKHVDLDRGREITTTNPQPKKKNKPNKEKEQTRTNEISTLEKPKIPKRKFSNGKERRGKTVKRAKNT